MGADTFGDATESQDSQYTEEEIIALLMGNEFIEKQKLLCSGCDLEKISENPPSHSTSTENSGPTSENIVEQEDSHSLNNSLVSLKEDVLHCDCSETDSESSRNPHSQSSDEKTKCRVMCPESETEGNIFYGNPHENRKRKKTADASMWKRQKNKKLRENGESYLGFRKQGTLTIQDQLRGERMMGPRCNSKQSDESKSRQCNEIPEEYRQQIFETFWKTMLQEQKKCFILDMVDTSSPKRRTSGDHSRRACTRTYYLKVKEEKKRLCLKIFLNTLGIKEWTVRYLKDNCNEHGMIKPEISKEKMCSNRQQHLKDFLQSLPNLPSHYCWKSTSKLYLEPVIQSKSHLYNIYRNHAEETGGQSLCRKAFDTVFDEMNISLYKTKKDECDLCCSYRVGNISNKEYEKHEQEKMRAREEKDKDKQLAIEGEVHTVAMDLQAVKVCPLLRASAVYFKTKLTLHNFTVYDLASHRAVCYWFNETAANLKASVFATMVVDYVAQAIDQDGDNCRPFILYSDGCTYQNRNVILSNALLRLAMAKNVVIIQKFLVKGHTQMECDSVHSAIETKLKNREIHLPSQYATVTKEARTKPFPYEVKELDHTFFRDYSRKEIQIYDSIRPGRLPNDPIVTDIRSMKYSPEGIIEYKLSFQDEFQPLPRRTRSVPADLQPRPLFLTPLKIPFTKYQHLQELKSVLPQDCHAFYDRLLSESKS